ncbi:MAG: 4-hydroxy-3-methylbut-2-enyl diphosphate reductase [Lentisphaeria bacterium]|nr:4-hydroxy-3-methylbut-2-enyl diphosphate reductase [Lentisphaeria bacterium]
MNKTLHIVSPLGVCSGVRRAMNLFDKLAESSSARPIYVLHELVHNRTVTESMRSRGAIFVNAVSEVPQGSIILLGAHGCPRSVIDECLERNLEIHDATCPLVRLLQENAKSVPLDTPVIFLGDGHHQEVLGVLDRLKDHQVHLIESAEEAARVPELDQAVFFSQTTRCFTEISAAADLLSKRVRNLDNRAHACDAVMKRQTAMREIAGACQAVIVIGSQNSSNARRLGEIALEAGCRKIIFTEDAKALDTKELDTISSIGLGTATSAPDNAISEVLERLSQLGFKSEEI